MLIMFSIMVASSAFVLSMALTPLSLGIWILLFSLVIALMISSFVSSWWGMVLFLIYIGGLLVMFAYFSAVTPNQQWELFPLFLFSFLLMLVLWLNNDLFFCPDPVLSFNNFYSSSFSPTKILELSNAILYLTLAVILFLALIMVVKISSLTSGPLRPFN
nr:NADH dehydrogenase subunit 6 [Chloeia pocicola]